MFCPKDGTNVGGPPGELVTGTYFPCPACGSLWRYSKSAGVLEMVTFGTPTPTVKKEPLIEEQLVSIHGGKERSMYCPKDGTAIPREHRLLQDDSAVYPPCLGCGAVWEVDESEDSYNLCKAPSVEEVADALRAEGADRRDLGVNALVASIVDIMERTALDKGQCTYYIGTFAVARETLATTGLTCELDPHHAGQTGLPEPRFRWTAFFGDDWEHLTREEAFRHLLAERS